MIRDYYYKTMRINERGDFSQRLLSLLKMSSIDDTNFQPYIADLEAKTLAYTKTLEKFTVTDITERMRDSDTMREEGIEKLKSLAYACSKRSDATVAAAGSKVLGTIKAIVWNPRSKGNAEETQLIDTLLSQLETSPDMVEAIKAIDGDEFLTEIKQAQLLYKLQEEQRTTVRSETRKSDTLEAARQLGTSIDRVVSYIDFQTDLNKIPGFILLTDQVNTVIAEFKAKIRNRNTRSQTQKQKNKG